MYSQFWKIDYQKETEHIHSLRKVHLHLVSMGNQFPCMLSRLDGASKTHRPLEKEENCSGRERNAIRYMPGYVSLKKN